MVLDPVDCEAPLLQRAQFDEAVVVVDLHILHDAEIGPIT